MNGGYFMQLQFEAAWDRAIAPADRQAIEALFEKTKDNLDAAIIRTALNYKKQVLISVLINNRSNEQLIFQNQTVRFQQIEQVFSTNALTIPPKTSMPWTFIFDATSGYDLHHVTDADFEILNTND